MPEPDSHAIASIQSRTDKALREGAMRAQEIGGPNAVSGFLKHSLCYLLGVAINEQGVESARELMAAGFITAQAYDDECSHGRRTH